MTPCTSWPNASVKPTVTQISVTTPSEAKLCIMIVMTFLWRTRPP